jgi:hypothetical protein
MPDLTPTASRIATNFSEECRVRSRKAAEALTPGVPVYYTAAGLAAVADANAAGKQQCRGICLDQAAAGESARILEDGWCDGFDLSGLARDAPVYLSDTAGALATTAGTMTVVVGRVDFYNDPAKTKTLRVYGDYPPNWA